MGPGGIGGKGFLEIIFSNFSIIFFSSRKPIPMPHFPKLKDAVIHPIVKSYFNVSLSKHKLMSPLSLIPIPNPDIVLYNEKENSSIEESNLNLIVGDRVRIIKDNLARKLGVISIWTIDLELNGKFEPIYIWIKIFYYIFNLFWNDVIITIPEDSTIILQLVGHSLEKDNWNVTPFIKLKKMKRI